MRILKTSVPALLASAILAAALLLGATSGSASQQTTAPQQAATSVETQAKAKPRTAKYGGTPPLWVTHPYLAETGDGRLAVKGQVYVDPFRRPSAARPAERHLRASADRLVFSVVVAKPAYANARKPVSVRLLPDNAILARRSQTVTPSIRRLVDLNVVLDRTTSKRLRAMSFARQRAATSIVVGHLKDTDEARNPRGVWGLTQTNDASLQRRVAPMTEQMRYLGLARRQILADRGAFLKGASDTRKVATSEQDSPMYNYVYVTNQTPFTQQVSFNPNIQCMWTGASAQYPGAQSVQVPSGGILQMAYVLEPNPYVGSLGTTWAGLNGATTGVNAPGTGESGVTALINAATSTGQSFITGNLGPGLDLAAEGDAGTIGVLALMGAASVKFMTTLIDDGVKGTCSTNASQFPETFGITTTVVGFGTNNQVTAWGPSSTPTTYTPPNNWNTIQPIPQPTASTFVDAAGTAPPIAGTISDSCTPWETAQPCYFPVPVKVGTQAASTKPTTCPEPAAGQTPSTWCTFVYNTLQPMMGAQTAATYYWNGGASSYMVSNNAAPGTYTGGSASFTGGLFQNVGPSPGQPGDAWCWGKGLDGVINCSYLNGENASQIQNYNPMGAMNIALTYLSTPQYEGGLYTGLAAGASGTPEPKVVVTQGQNASGEPGLNVTCDLSGIQPYLSLPFSPGGGTTTTNGPALLSTQVNAAGNMPTGSWNVSFYGVDSNSNPVYYNTNVGSPALAQGGWSWVSPSAFTLGPNLTSTVTSTFNVAQNAMPTGFIPYADFGNLQTVQNINYNGQVATLAGIGCSVSPVLSVEGLDITGNLPGVSSVFGQIVPIVGPYTGGTTQPSGWPMPGGGVSSWPNNLYNGAPWNTWTQYAWQTPVNQVNVAFQGTPISATTKVNCTAPTSTAAASCTIPAAG